MSMRNKAMHPRTEILLFQSARAQHVEELIKPALASGKVVICDRFTDSTMAYQGYGHQSDLVFLRRLLDFTTGSLKPDLTLLLDVDVETGLKRRQAGGGEWNRLDDYDLAFHQRVRAGYHELAKQEPDRWVTVDARQSKEEIQTAIRKILKIRLALSS